MTGILSYGAYVPPTRIGFATLAGRPAKPDDAGPERAVAWSGRRQRDDGRRRGARTACAASTARASTRSSFASTTHPFLEKQTAALVAKVLDLRRDVATADHAGSLRAGTTALRAAVDAVAAGSARRVLVIASDCRLGAPGSALERSFGDGAAAFLVGDADAIATFEGAHAVADEIVDVWRSQEDRFVHSWEERFVVQEGLLPNLIEAVRGLLAKLPRGAGRRHARRPLRARRAQPREPGARAAARRRSSSRTRCSDGSATPARPSRRCCWPRRSSRRGPASA